MVDPGNILASIKATAWSSTVLSVCLAIAFNRSTINLFIAFDLIKTRRIGLKIFTIGFMCYFPNIALLLVLDKNLNFYGRSRA